MRQIPTVLLALVAGAITLVFAAQADAGGMRRPSGPHWGHHGPGWGQQAWRRHGWNRQAWFGRRHGRYGSGWWGGPIYDAGSGVAVVNGGGYPVDPDPAQTAALDREPSFGGWVYRAGRAADGSVYANSYRSYQPYAPPVIIRIP